VKRGDMESYVSPGFTVAPEKALVIIKESGAFYKLSFEFDALFYCVL